MAANPKRNKRPQRRTASSRIGRGNVLARIGPELKYVDAQVSNSFDYNGLIQPLSNTALGDDISQRTGRSLHPVALDINARVTVAATSPVTCRFMIVRLLFDQGSLTAAKILSTVGSGYVTSSPYNIDYHGQSKRDRRFEVLLDETFTVSTNYIPVHEIKRKMRLGGAHSLLRYESGNAEPVYGALVCLVFSTLAGPAGLPAVTAVFRTHFYDA